MKKSLPLLPSACCAPDAAPLDQAEAEALATSLRALADPARVLIVNRLARAAAGLTVAELVDGSGLAQPTVSHHLKLLRDAGLVSVERRGTASVHRLERDRVTRVSAAIGCC